MYNFNVFYTYNQETEYLHLWRRCLVYCYPCFGKKRGGAELKDETEDEASLCFSAKLGGEGGPKEGHLGIWHGIGFAHFVRYPKHHQDE